MADHPAAADLRNAMRLLESDRGDAAISSLLRAESLLAQTTGDAANAVGGAIEAFKQGNDRSAVSWTRIALGRLS